MLHSHDLHFISQRMHQALLEARLRQDEASDLTHMGIALPASVADKADDAHFQAEMDEFERQMEAQEMVSVHERIGSPVIIPPDDLAKADIPAALDRLIDCFVDHNICIDFFGDYSPEEMYRAIVEDLLHQEIVQLTAPGWVSHIVHTPPRFQVKQHVTLFVHSVLGKDSEMLLDADFSLRPQYDDAGTLLAPDAFARDLGELWSRLGTICHADVQLIDLEIADGKATTSALIHWHTNVLGGCGAINAYFELQMLDEDCWQLLKSTFVTDMLRYL